MPSLKHCFAWAVGFLVFAGAVANAAPIDPNLSVSGSATYDNETVNPGDGFSYVDNASHSGTLTVTVGGSTTTTTYGATSDGFLDGTTTGANPLNGALTDIGDGFGVTGTAGGTSDADGDAEFGIGVDVVMTITNNSGTDIFQVTIRTTYSHTVDSSGPDGYADSEFTLDSMLNAGMPTEEFFTQLVTDTKTPSNNVVNGTQVSSVGGTLTDSGGDTLVLTLNPGDSFVITGDWTMEGGGFFDGDESFGGLEGFNVSLIIADVQNLSAPIPEPGTLALLGLGLVGLGGTVIRKRRKSKKSA